MFDTGGVAVFAEARTADDDVAAALAFARSRVGRSTMAQDLAVRWALANPEAARLAGARPGPVLAWRLSDLAVADAPREELLEAVGAWDRMGAWVVSQQAKVLQELQRRAAGSTWAEQTVREDVAATLAISGRAGRIVTDRAQELTAAPEVHDALAAGAVSVRKADVLLSETGTLTTAQARRVHEQVLPDAHQLTAPQVRAAARDAVLRLEPDAAQTRHHRARADRTVVLEPAADCMATLRAYLPADDALRAWHALDTLAATAASQDPRGIDARRADALVDLLTGAGSSTVAGAGVDPADAQPARPRRQGRAPRLNLTISADALAGASTAPAHLDRYGPVLPTLARALAADAAWHVQRTDPTTGEAVEQPGSRYRPPEALRQAIIARDVTCTFPGCRTTAWTCDIDHIIPFDDTHDPADQTRRSNLTALCRHHHNLKTHGHWTPRRDPDTGTTVWTSPTGKPYTRPPLPAPGEQPQPSASAAGYGPAEPAQPDATAGPARPDLTAGPAEPDATAGADGADGAHGASDPEPDPPPPAPPPF